MASSGAPHRSGYRQPVQARAFGTGSLILGGMVVLVLFGIQRIAPPIRPVDAGRAAVFTVESIPLDPIVEPSEPAPTRQPPSERSPSSRPAAAVMAAPLVPPQGEPASTIPTALPFPSQATGAPISIANGDAPSPPALAAPAAPVSSPAAAADWRAWLLGHLKRYRRYPRQAEATRQQGIVRIAITLRRSGEVTAVELIHGSGYPLLDQEARATVRRASPVPPVDDAVPDPDRTDPMTAIGWLWVAEGSNLGAASLSRRAAALGLDGSFGARHLTAHPDGRGPSWKAFTKAVNQLDLDHADNARMLQGARDAFAHVRILADAAFA